MFEVWTRRSGNRLLETNSVDDALAFVRQFANEYGLEWATSLVLGRITAEGKPERVLAGDDLLERAGIHLRPAAV